MNKPNLMSMDDALAAVLAQAARVDAFETLDTFDADGRVLWADAVSDLQVPPLDNSAMDGYAVRCADIVQAGVLLPVSQRIAAGQVGEPLAAGTAARIFTGAPVPPGADAIVMQEDTELVDGQVRITAVPRAEQWIRRAGEDIAKGSTILKAGTRLNPAALGLLASIGLGKVQVARKPRVAMFSTGDELVMPGDVLPKDMPPGSIYNSNRFFLRALLVRLGCEVNDCGIVPDNREATIKVMQDAAEGNDLIVSTAGVSVGEEDHVKPAVEQLGELNLWKISMKPGKPFAFGKVRREAGGSAHFMGLPGNPVSSFVTFLMMVRPFLLRLQGAEHVTPRALYAPANFDLNKPDARREFLRVRLNEQGALELFGNQSSGVLTSAVWGDGLADNPAMNIVKKGDVVRFIPMSELLQ